MKDANSRERKCVLFQRAEIFKNFVVEGEKVTVILVSFYMKSFFSRYNFVENGDKVALNVYYNNSHFHLK